MALQNREESEEEISYDFQDLRRRFIHLEERSHDSQQSRRLPPEEKAHNFEEIRSRFMNGEEESKDIRGGTTGEKCNAPLDSTLTFVQGDDEMDFSESKDVLRSCCHSDVSHPLVSLFAKEVNSVWPPLELPAHQPAEVQALVAWGEITLFVCTHCDITQQGECRFVCGQTGCDVEWTYEEVCKMALLTPEERDYFEKKMFSNAAKNYLDVKFCPGCKCRVVRTNLHNLSVCCTLCTAEKKKIYLLCWQCLREVKTPAVRLDHCENDGCISQPLETLRNCPDIIFESVKGVTGCPSIRACPTCGFLVEHNKRQCKTMVCPRCKVKFCFVCLQFTQECLKKKPYDLCSSGVAPRQTAIPVWQRT